MPAPTALQRAPEALKDQTVTDLSSTLQQDDLAAIVPLTTHSQSTNSTNDTTLTNIKAQEVQPTNMDIDTSSTPLFQPETPSTTTHILESRKVSIPPHRMAPLKTAWPKIYPPLVEHLQLQVRMNLKAKAVELRTSKSTTDSGALQKGEDFVKAFSLGFDVDDAIALLRLDDLYIETFEIKDVKTLQGEHLSRAIGRIAGKDGRTKFAIENASRTRLVVADSKIHILGGFKNIHIAREAVVSLILGSQPGKVYANLRTVASRMKERF